MEKWYIIFARGRESWPKGYDIDDIVAAKGVGGLRPIFGTRSHNTVVKRANSIIRYTHWFLKHRFSINPFPITSVDLEDYLESLQLEEASASAANSSIEAIRYCDKVLNIQGLSQAVSPKALNLSEIANANRKEKRQARTLTVNEVRSLESFMADEKNVVVDRFACGCFLFALFSRSRWSDLRCVYGFASDIMEMDGKIVGYLEFKTRSHKTARLVQRQGLSMPLVAPAWGVGSTPWAIEFAKVAKLAARPLDSLHNTPLLAAPNRRRLDQQVHEHSGGQELVVVFAEKVSWKGPRSHHHSLSQKHRLKLGRKSRPRNRDEAGTWSPQHRQEVSRDL